MGIFEMPVTQKNADVKFNKQVALSKGKSFYSHCYVILRLYGKEAKVEYYEDRDAGRLIWDERI